MKIELGNDGALTLESGEFVPMDGEFVTTFSLPEDTPTTVALMNVLDAIPYHFQRDASPVWVRSTNPEVQRLLGEHFGAETTRPRDWGKKDDDE